jgi:hypothetical protein
MTIANTLGFWWAWPAALLAYILFRAWYDNWHGPLSKEEIEQFSPIYCFLLFFFKFPFI